jgi:hypothetical protein
MQQSPRASGRGRAGGVPLVREGYFGFARLTFPDVVACWRVAARLFLLLTVIGELPAVALPQIMTDTSTAGSAAMQSVADPADTADTKLDAIRTTAADCATNDGKNMILTDRQTAPYTPLSARSKFDLFARQTYSPYTLISAGFQATWAQATAQWPQYGGGTREWGKRFGATLADTESRIRASHYRHYSIRIHAFSSRRKLRYFGEFGMQEHE